MTTSEGNAWDDVRAAIDDLKGMGLGQDIEASLGTLHKKVNMVDKSKKTPDEWAALDGITVADPDGWRFIHVFGPGRDYDPQDWSVPITRQEWDDRVSVSSVIGRPAKTKEVQKWADVAMFQSEPLDARKGPSVHLLHANNDPLGSIAAMALMYKGIVVRDLADVTDEQRREMFTQITQTKLKAPFEAVKFHWMVEGVTRSLTHQMVRQRTAVFAQESLRFAVVEDGFAQRTSLPPSLAGTEGGHVEHSGPEYDRLSQAERQRIKWDRALDEVQATYAELVADGMPAEDARGLLPHNITTRLNYVTDLRNFQDHAGARLCTQAQFEWRALWIAFVKELRRYGTTVTYRVRQGVTASHAVNAKLANGYQVAEVSSAWQFDLIADLFRPACYLTGKCEFAAQDLDRKCTIRDRVDANHHFGRASSEWHLPLTVANDGVNSAEVVPIHPGEWLTDPGAAR